MLVGIGSDKENNLQAAAIIQGIAGDCVDKDHESGNRKSWTHSKNVREMDC
jgi:hypothetical protein